MPVTERLTDHRESYFPGLRTALVLTGTGTDGAYHAGVLRGLTEAGVKIDLVAGRGIGAAGALFTALDGAPRLWDDNGLWRKPGLDRCYRWRPALRVAGWAGVALVGVLLSPLAFLALGLFVYPGGFLLQMLGLDAGQALIAAYGALVANAFAPGAVPTVVPRAGMIVLAVFFFALLGASIAAYLRAPARRRERGHLVWRLFGAPMAARDVQHRFLSSLSDLIRGPAPAGERGLTSLGRRFAEVLAENLGQPGFRDLIYVVHDLDARRDLVFAMLRDPFRRPFFTRTETRTAEAFDLAGVARDYACEALAGTLVVPVAAEAHLLTFAPDSYWRGETHRIADRPASLVRLLDEVALAGVDQGILVSGAPQAIEPHRLRARRVDGRGRLGEALAGDERAALHDAVVAAHHRFKALFVVQPTYNPLGPFDFTGSYDESSDRRHTLAELMAQGYEDAYHQFIEPVVGGSGERLAAEQPIASNGLTYTERP